MWTWPSVDTDSSTMDSINLFAPSRRPRLVPIVKRRARHQGAAARAGRAAATAASADFFLLEGGVAAPRRLQAEAKPAPRARGTIFAREARVTREAKEERKGQGLPKPRGPILAKALLGNFFKAKKHRAAPFLFDSTAIWTPNAPSAAFDKGGGSSFFVALPAKLRVILSAIPTNFGRFLASIPTSLVALSVTLVALFRGKAAKGAAVSQKTALFDRSRLLRFGIAAGAAALLVGVSLLAFQLATPVFPLPEGGLLKASGSGDEALLDFLTPELTDTPTETSLPPLPKSLVTESYIVRKGDSLATIAARRGLKVDTLVSMNGISSARTVHAGMELKIPNMNGIVHVVGKGESLSSIAQANGTTVTALADANDLGSSTLRPGQAVFVPGARLAPSELRKVFGEYVAWPARGPISSYFGYRADPFTGVKRFHGGIDIVVDAGTPVKSVMDGRVADVGYNNLFGNYIIVNYSEGMQALYGHLSRQDVRDGMAVSQGQVIGLSGNTGYSTAAHLHFGLYRGGVSVNPLKYLK